MKESYHLIAGVDEVGRGAWAGPLVACAIIMPQGKRITGVADSKQLSHQQRIKLFPKIVSTAISCVVVSVPQTDIDQLGVHQANMFALSYCITHLDPAPELILVDGFVLHHYLPIKKIIHGDATNYTIGAASIVAKVVRDTLMHYLDTVDGKYMFGQHKGYGTALHQQQLKKYGISPYHRKSFAPIHKLLYT
ncbi:MAG: ribonuclease HII [Patescibacteria group bacterium]|jgi:ribonuclease HII